MVTAFKPSRVPRLRELTQELIAEEISLQMFLKLSPDLHCIISSEGYLVRLNDAWERQLGWSQQEFLEHPLTSFLHPDDTDTVISHLNVVTGEPTRFLARLRLKDTKDYITYDWSLALGKDGRTYAAARQITSN
jgi:PAS domain S-box-containing protein